METIWQGRVVGEFLGYAGGRVYELSDGSRWKQESTTDEPVYRINPGARLLNNRSTDTRFLDVEGTSGIVEVKPDRGARPRAF